MKFNNLILFLIPAAAIALFEGCMPDEVEPRSRVPILPAEVYDYATLPMQTPEDFKPFGNYPLSNEVAARGELAYYDSRLWLTNPIIDNRLATLGRVLFYDQRLSANNRVSCGSCHRQQFAFADNSRFSTGFMNELTGRNTQQIVNAGMQGGLFWDLRERVLDHMVLQPIANHLEMGLSDTLEMEERIRSASYYAPLFEDVYGTPEVTTKKIGEALAQFVKSIVSVSSKYDQGLMSLVNSGQTANQFEPFPNFTEKENLGKELFFRKFFCSQCHGGDNFNGANPSFILEANIGLDDNYADHGVAGIDQRTGQINNGKFKVPSLRNIALTAPYMHDGRFQTLEQVVEFYNSGIKPHPQLADELRQQAGSIVGSHMGPMIPADQIPIDGRVIPIRMHMNGEERAAIVAFLKTLTDYHMVTDPKFSDPFQVVE